MPLLTASFVPICCVQEGFAPVDMSFLDDMAELFMDQPTDAPPANEPPPSVGSLSALRDPRRPGFVPAPEPSGILMIPLEQPVHDVEEARKPVPAVPDRTARRLAQRAPQRGALEKLKASREIRGNRITKPSATLSSFKARPRNVRAESPPVQLESESESDSGSHWDADEVAKPQKPASMKPKPIKVARPAPPRPYAFAKPIIKPPPAKPKARAPPAVPAPAPDVRPLGRSTAPVAPVAKRPLSATTSRAKPPEADAHAQAMKAISEVQRLRQLVQREESLLAKARSGRVPLKDGGKKLEERLEAQRAELEMKANAVQGRVLSYRDREGKRQGPFTPHQLEAMSREGLVPPGAQIFHKEGRIFSLEEAIALPEPLTATLLRELQAQHAATKSPGTKDPGNGTDDPGVRKAPAGRNSDTDHGALRRMGPPQKRQREWHGERQQPQSQLQLEQPPSAWQVAAQVEALKDAQEVSHWTFFAGFLLVYLSFSLKPFHYIRERHLRSHDELREVHLF